MINHNQPCLGKKERLAALKILSNNSVSDGLEVLAFENDLCNFFGLPHGHATVVSSGSAALYLALLALNGKNKRIAMPVYSCSSLRNAVSLVGGKSIFIDCEEGGPNLDFNEVKNKKPKILIAPSMYGIPVIFPKIRNYHIIEDLSQAIGAKYRGNKIGLRGDVGICSFYATKMITSGGQGGAIISKNKKIINKIKDFREFDCRKDTKFRFNFKMTDLQAAIGRVQLSRLPNFLEKRENWFKIYKNSGLNLLESNSKQINSVRYRIIMQCKNPKQVIYNLAKSGIKAIIPIEEYELLDNPKKYFFANKLCKTTVSLPAHLGLKKTDIFKIIKIVKETL